MERENNEFTAEQIEELRDKVIQLKKDFPIWIAAEKVFENLTADEVLDMAQQEAYRCTLCRDEDSEKFDKIMGDSEDYPITMYANESGNFADYNKNFKRKNLEESEVMAYERDEDTGDFILHLKNNNVLTGEEAAKEIAMGAFVYFICLNLKFENYEEEETEV